MMTIGKEPIKAMPLIEYHGTHLTTNGGIGNATPNSSHLDPDPDIPSDNGQAGENEPQHRIEDYYASEGQGKWFGAGAEVLGLNGQQITSEAFAALACGFTPDGKAIAQKAGNPNRDAAWDIAFTAPKGVSAVWATVTDPNVKQAIQAAMDKAVETTLTELMSKVTARTGAGGAIEKKADCIAGLFDHGTNRSAEPNLHKHAVFLNLGHHGNGKWASINSHSFYDLKKVYGAMFRVTLADELKKAGFVIDRTYAKETS